MKPLLGSIATLALAAPVYAQTGARATTVGVIRWDAWIDHTIHTSPNYPLLWDWTKNVSDPRWQFKWSFFAKTNPITGSLESMTDENQSTIDQEIRFAVAGGIDYWAIDTVGWTTDPNCSLWNYGLKFFNSSNDPAKKYLKIAFLLLGGQMADTGPNHSVNWTNFVNNTIVPQIESTWTPPGETTAISTYQRTPDGRPIIFIFNSDGMVCEWDYSLETCPSAKWGTTGYNGTNLQPNNTIAALNVLSNAVYSADRHYPYFIGVSGTYAAFQATGMFQSLSQYGTEQQMQPNLWCAAGSCQMPTDPFNPTGVYARATTNCGLGDLSQCNGGHGTYANLMEATSDVFYWTVTPANQNGNQLNYVPTLSTGFDPRPRWNDQSGYFIPNPDYVYFTSVANDCPPIEGTFTGTQYPFQVGSFNFGNACTSQQIYGTNPYYDPMTSPAQLAQNFMQVRAWETQDAGIHGSGGGAGTGAVNFTATDPIQTALMYAWDEIDEGIPLDAHFSSSGIPDESELDALSGTINSNSLITSISSLGCLRGSGGSCGADYGGWVGNHFKMSASTTSGSFASQQMGFYCDSSDFSSHNLKLVDAGGATLIDPYGTVATINCDGYLGWKYAPLPEVLLPNHDYYEVVSTNNLGPGFFDFDGTTVTTTSDGQIVDAVYYLSATSSYYTIGKAGDNTGVTYGAGQSYGPVNIMYSNPAVTGITSLGLARNAAHLDGYNGWVGMHFEVNQGITPQYVGFYCDSSDQTSHQMKFVDASTPQVDPIGGSSSIATVSCPGTTGWQYAKIGGVGLLPGTGLGAGQTPHPHDYFLVASVSSTSGTFYDFNGTIVTNRPAVNIIDAVFGAGGVYATIGSNKPSPECCASLRTAYGSGQSYGPVDFIY